MTTHKFIHGDLLKKCPAGISPDQWQVFLDEMDRANALEEMDHPVQIDLELNSGCNMKCPFCTHGVEDIKNKNVDIERYKALIDEAVSLGAKSIKLNYINEPMMRKDLEDVIEYARGAGMLNIYMATNGSMLTGKRRRRLIESGITKIFISIDAITAETYDKQRLDGRYEKIVSNVLALIAERNEMGLEFPIVRVSFLKNAINIHEAEAFGRFWEGKADLIAYQKMNEIPDSDTGLVINKDNLSDDPCTFPFKQLVVDADGDILPCCTTYGKKLAIGNISSMSLSDAWHSDKAKAIRKMHRDGSWKLFKTCRDCMSGE